LGGSIISRWWGLQSQFLFDAVDGCISHVRDLGDFFYGVAIPLEQPATLSDFA
jgi:hypothetical protein